MFIRLRRYLRSSRALYIFVSLSLLTVTALAWRMGRSTSSRYGASDLPLAFWAWRDDLPSKSDVDRVRLVTGSNVLFVRAGQLDYTRAGIETIRRPHGEFPKGVKIHLVYNATRELLSAFERVDETSFSQGVALALQSDLDRATSNGATVSGVQLDIDVPSRLLGHYRALLAAVRRRTPPALGLSITGLPTWTQSRELKEVLGEVDFWTPQCYGARVPQKLSNLTSISSSEVVGRCIREARNIGAPYYAGIAAYGYALLFDSKGELLMLRGDLDPSLIANDPTFDLISEKPVPAHGRATIYEWQYIFRATQGGIVEGLAYRKGDTLVLDITTTGALADSLQIASKEGGSNLEGVCIFRLPTRADRTNLMLEQVIQAKMNSGTIITPSSEQPLKAELTSKSEPGSFLISIRHSGAVNARIGPGALTILIPIVPGSVASISSTRGLSSAELQCGSVSRSARVPPPSTCTSRRANLLVLESHAWMSGDSAQVELHLTSRERAVLPATARIKNVDGSETSFSFEITPTGGRS